MTQRDDDIDDKVTVIEGEYVYKDAPKTENTQVVLRDERGKWIKGHSPTPPRKPKRDRTGEHALIQALESALPPDKIEYYLGQALEFAIHWKSSSAVVEILKLRLAYGLGMPVQRSITASTKLDDLLNRVAELDDEQFDRLEESI
jgi:hypothetical protein